MADDTTLTQIMEAAPVTFEVDGATFRIRQPYDDEVDSADHLYRVAYAKAMAEPDIKALKDEPCSESTKSLYEALAALEEQLAAKLPDDATAEREHKLAEAQRLRQSGATRTAAQELAHDRALTVKERWLCVHLLCDANGKPMFDPDSEADIKRWRRCSRKVKEAARPAIRKALRLVEDAPFA